jgi:hypothetical protein
MSARSITARPAGYPERMSGEYHGLTSRLPSPVRTLTLKEIQADVPGVLAQLQQGGAILVESDDEQTLLGVLTREKGLLDEAELGAMIQNGQIPPLEELLAMDDRGETP